MSYETGLERPIHTETIYINISENELSVESVAKKLDRGSIVLTDSKYMRINDTDVTSGKLEIRHHMHRVVKANNGVKVQHVPCICQILNLYCFALPIKVDDYAISCKWYIKLFLYHNNVSCEKKYAPFWNNMRLND